MKPEEQIKNLEAEISRLNGIMDDMEAEITELNQINVELAEKIKDGYAEGKPQWHEIERHVKPNREISKKYMPKGKEKVLLKFHFYGDEEIHYSDGYYEPYDFEFHIPVNPHGKIVCVIAWCELYKE